VLEAAAVAFMDERAGVEREAFDEHGQAARVGLDVTRGVARAQSGSQRVEGVGGSVGVLEAAAKEHAVGGADDAPRDALEVVAGGLGEAMEKDTLVGAGEDAVGDDGMDVEVEESSHRIPRR